MSSVYLDLKPDNVLYHDLGDGKYKFYLGDLVSMTSTSRIVNSFPHPDHKGDKSHVDGMFVNTDQKEQMKAFAYTLAALLILLM